MSCINMALPDLIPTSGKALQLKFSRLPLSGTLLCLLAFQFIQPSAALGSTRFYDFKVQPKSVTKLCKTKSIVTVNGQYPGPTLYAQQGDRIIVKVTNLVRYNMTLHWHGVRQQLSCWSDGAAYITQCPIETGQSFTYEFTLFQEKGTLWWHAHITWLRATVHGAIVIYPKTGVPYPFQFPFEEHVIVLGEYWLRDPDNIEKRVLQTGGGPATPDAYLINGHPGPLFNCSAEDMYILTVIPGKTYLLRIINAALNEEHFFSIANHWLTVVEADGEYLKPFRTQAIMIAPGQTTNVLVTAEKSGGKFYMSMASYSSNPKVPFLATPALALFRYQGNNSLPPIIPRFPANNDTGFATMFMSELRGLATSDNPMNVPQTIDRNLFFTIGLNSEKCPLGQTCKGPGAGRLAASMNNISFQLPSTSILQAYHDKVSGVYTTDFPDNPPIIFDFLNNAPNSPPKNTQSMRGTRVNVLDFNSNVQLILQNTGTVGTENHPIHLHGYSFYVVGFGFGVYNQATATLNLRDPPLRNTIGVPVGGWAVIRFKADNPGVWFVHCHLEVHTTWGLSMAFIVKNGVGPSQTLPGPPADLPTCGR